MRCIDKNGLTVLVIGREAIGEEARIKVEQPIDEIDFEDMDEDGVLKLGDGKASRMVGHGRCLVFWIGPVAAVATDLF